MAITASLARLSSSLIAVMRNRLELAAVEFEEETLRLFDYLLHSLIALFFLGLSFTLCVVLLIAVFWDTHRIAVLIVLAVLFGFIGVQTAHAAKTAYKHKPPLLKDTLAELNKDMEALRAASQADSNNNPPSNGPSH